MSTSSDLATWTALTPTILATSTGTESVGIVLAGQNKLFIRIEIIP